MSYTEKEHNDALDRMWFDMNGTPDRQRKINWDGVFTAFLVGVLGGLVTIGVAAWVI